MLVIEALSEVALTVLFLIAMRVLAGRGPEPDLDTFGTLEDGE